MPFTKKFMTGLYKAQTYATVNQSIIHYYLDIYGFPTLLVLAILYEEFCSFSTPRGHLPLIAPNCMSLSALGTNPYNLGNHFECHQESPAVDSSR